MEPSPPIQLVSFSKPLQWTEVSMSTPDTSSIEARSPKSPGNKVVSTLSGKRPPKLKLRDVSYMYANHWVMKQNCKCLHDMIFLRWDWINTFPIQDGIPINPLKAFIKRAMTETLKLMSFILNKEMEHTVLRWDCWISTHIYPVYAPSFNLAITLCCFGTY